MIIAEIILAIVQLLPELIPLLEKLFQNFHGQPVAARIRQEAELHSTLASWYAKGITDDQLKAKLQDSAVTYGIAV